MTMYDELVNSLRICGKIRSADDYCVAFHDGCCGAEPVCMYELMMKAVDAIEELSRKYIEERNAAVELTGELASKPRWIPVTERLPEKGYYVLAYEDDDILMASYADGNWVLRDMYEIIDDLKPTHWMPLSEPPKEET